MKKTALTLLQLLLEGKSDQEQLMVDLGIKDQQFNKILKDLRSQEYVENSKIELKPNAKVILLKNLAEKYDLQILLHDSNEKVLYTLSDPMTKIDLVEELNLSNITIHRSLAELQSIGAIIKTDNRYMIKYNDENLTLFVKLLKKEANTIPLEKYTNIIFKDESRILKKVPKGKPSDGELTAFSLFSDYGLQYVTSYDYYIQQPNNLQLEDIIIHSVLTSEKGMDKNSMIIAILFYIKNRDKVDILELRNVARSFKILDTWLDIESYVRNGQIKNQQLFPTREEFREKAELYNMSMKMLELPEAYPNLFIEIGELLKGNITAYLIGGENMRIKMLKDRTKDCDIVVKDKEQYYLLLNTLERMGYRSINKKNMSSEDKRINPSDILTHVSRSRLDIFINTIGRKLYLSKRMTNRAEIKQFGLLKIGILKNEDVFLLKSVTGREGDVHDMAKIIQSGRFEWNVVWDELNKQEEELGHDYLFVFFLDQIDSLYEQTGIRPPFYKTLLRKIIDNKIKKLIENGGKPLSEVTHLLASHGISETMIRSRIDYLFKNKRINKLIINNVTTLQPIQKYA